MYLCPEIQTIKIMSTYTEDTRKVTTHRLMEMKLRGEKISMLTAYDFSMATLIDQAGIDVIQCNGRKCNDVTYHSRPNDLSWEIGCPSR